MKTISSNFPKNNADVCVIITVYRSDNHFPRRVERIKMQVGLVIIVIDDGLASDEKDKLDSYFLDKSKIVISCLPENLGIAAALNVGISIARQQGYRWVLTLDDDTIVEPDMVENLINSWQFISRQEGKPIAIMGMSYADAHIGSIAEISNCKGKLFVEKRGIITSGSLLSLDAHDVIGPFREEFFMDSVDYDYCMRARVKGYRVIKICRIGMIHSLGEARLYRFGCFKVQTTNHSAIRRYYMYRNSTVLAREYFLSDPFYSISVFLFQLKTSLLVLFLEEDNRMKFRCMFRGVLDGWMNRLGKVDTKLLG
jgi:rhamnosyltransferase